MYKMLIGFILSLSCTANAMMRVAVIDSGYTGEAKNFCPTGHRDFTGVVDKDVVGTDDRNHGTHVINAINKYAHGDYCIIVLKVFNSSDSDFSGGRVIEAIDYAVSLKVDIINMSLDGKEPMAREREALASALNKGIKVFVAAGNKGADLDKNCISYPACYKLSSSVVSAKDKKANHAGFAFNKQPWCFEDICGTSLSTGIATGKFITNMEKYK